MIPLSHDEKSYVIDALKAVCGDENFDAVMGMRLIDFLSSERYMIFDVVPQCMAIVNDAVAPGEQCARYGRYTPLIVLADIQGNPLGNVQLALHVCEAHATSRLDKVIPENTLDSIIARFSQQGHIIGRSHCKLMYNDSETGMVVSPPNVELLRG